jgi:hypothetical protein
MSSRQPGRLPVPGGWCSGEHVCVEDIIYVVCGLLDVVGPFICPSGAGKAATLMPDQLLPQLSRVQLSQEGTSAKSSTLLRLTAELSPA